LSALAGPRFVGLDHAEKAEVCLEERFEVNYQKSMSPDRRPEKHEDLLRDDSRVLDK
jgi:hypothetical protein